ncbi:hypothetical protein ACN28S_06880 [Cystobacter fuscus]
MKVLALVALGAGLAGVCVLPPFRSMREHDERLERIEQALMHLPLPAGLEQLGVYSRVGLLSGNGNHCDYLSAMALRGAAERSVLEEFYRQHTVSSPDGYPLEIRIGAGGLQPAPGYDDDLLADSWMDAFRMEGQQVRVVYVFDGGLNPDGDPRCH